MQRARTARTSCQVVDKKQKVLHVISLQDEMNQVKLSDGRMPQKAGECLADQDAGYKVGDTIKLRSGTSDEVKDTLTTDTLKVGRPLQQSDVHFLWTWKCNDWYRNYQCICHGAGRDI